jgi:dCTP deaminase
MVICYGVELMCMSQLGVLVDVEIRQALDSKEIEIHPYIDTSFQPNSFDLHLSDSFVAFNHDFPYDQFVVDPYVELPNEIMEFANDIKEYTIYPGEFVLASTIEYIKLPGNICGILSGKSSIARLGLSIHQTGGFVDAGFVGQLTLELFNAFPYPIKLLVGMPIAQISFIRTSMAQNPYGQKQGSKYQYQSGAVISKYFENEKA